MSIIKFRCWDDETPAAGWIAHLGGWYEEDFNDCFDLEWWLLDWYTGVLNKH